MPFIFKTVFYSLLLLAVAFAVQDTTFTFWLSTSTLPSTTHNESPVTETIEVESTTEQTEASEVRTVDNDATENEVVTEMTTVKTTTETETSSEVLETTSKAESRSGEPESTSKAETSSGEPETTSKADTTSEEPETTSKADTTSEEPETTSKAETSTDTTTTVWTSSEPEITPKVETSTTTVMDTTINIESTTSAEITTEFPTEKAKTTTMDISTTVEITTEPESTTKEIPTTTVKPDFPQEGEWNITDGNVTCIRAKLNMEFSVYLGDEVKTFPLSPNALSSKSTCHLSNTTQMLSLEYEDYRLIFIFEEDSTGVYVQNTTFVYVNADVFYNDTKMFLVASGYSYLCKKIEVVPMQNVTMKINSIHIQAFGQSKEDGYGTAEECGENSFMSDVIPITVACTLSALIILALIIYLVRRRTNRTKGYMSV